MGLSKLPTIAPLQAEHHWSHAGFGPGLWSPQTLGGRSMRTPTPGPAPARPLHTARPPARLPGSSPTCAPAEQHVLRRGPVRLAPGCVRTPEAWPGRWPALSAASASH